MSCLCVSRFAVMGGAPYSPYTAEIKGEVIKETVIFLIKSFSPSDSAELLLSFLAT